MKQYILPIKGMHCRSCEILIEEKLKEISDVKSVQVSYKKKMATIYSKKEVLEKAILAAVREAGYEVGEDNARSWISRDLSIYKDLVVSALILSLVYLIFKKTGIRVPNTSSGNPSSYFVVILVGLTAGFSTCMALVGGLILGISARFSEKHPEASPIQKFRPHLFFNLGRISSYTLLGGIIGLLGKAFQLSGTILGALTIGVGLVMFTLGLQLTEVFPRLSSGGLTLPTNISKLLGIKKHHEKEYSHLNSVIVGALTFFLPCGFTQAMQLYAISTGNFFAGALIMGFFALGTAPGLLGIGGLTSALQGNFAKKFFKFAGLVVLLLALSNIRNGLNLTGWRAALDREDKTASAEVSDPNVKQQNGYQIVYMDQVGGGYRPNSFKIKKGIPVKWIITSKSDSCAASIYSPKLGIRQNLSPGRNEIDFTPEETGTIPFSCAMGMYTGKFTVIENQESSSKPTATPSPTLPAPTPTSNSSSANEQVIAATYTLNEDITPKKFTVKAGQPVRFEITPKEDGEGCMSSITIPKLVKNFEYLEKGKTIVFNFTPTTPGVYYITCAMGSERGVITVI